MPMTLSITPYRRKSRIAKARPIVDQVSGCDRQWGLLIDNGNLAIQAGAAEWITGLNVDQLRRVIHT
jgi:hypothetical protein